MEVAPWRGIGRIGDLAGEHHVAARGAGSGTGAGRIRTAVYGCRGRPQLAPLAVRPRMK